MFKLKETALWLVFIWATILLLTRIRVRNCPGCAWAVDGQCGHPTASQVPEAAEIQMGAWRCPWRELRGRSAGPLDALDTCERCGRLPRIESRELHRQDREEYAAVCPRCGWRTEWHCSVEETVAAWNRGERFWPVGRRTMNERA